MSTDTLEHINTLETPPVQPCNCPWEPCDEVGAWQQTCSKGHALTLYPEVFSTWCEAHKAETDRMYRDVPELMDQVSRTMKVRCHVCREHVITPFIWVHL